jgi:ABC-type transport system involved in cytochrome c biogenesis ATPase subunit
MHTHMLWGRRSECVTLDRLLEAARAGQSRALVVRGEAGVGKAALLEYLVGAGVGVSGGPGGGCAV